MRKLVILMLLLSSLFIFAGCAGLGMYGGIYTDIKGPVTTTNLEKGSKTGEASCLNVLGIVATGDCSIATAAKNGQITKIKTVDEEVSSILGLYLKRKVIVTGE